MNLILLFKEDFSDGSCMVKLKGRRLKHVFEVHRAEKGDTLCVGLEGGKIGVGKVLHIDDKIVEMEVSLDNDPPKKKDVNLILSLPRPIVLKRILLSATSMGVKNIYLINSWRVEKSYWNSPSLNIENIKEQLVLGLEQAKDTILPEISLHKLFKEFVNKDLRNIITNRNAFVAHPDNTSNVPSALSSPAVIAIGPEGGFIDKEIDTFKDHGFLQINIGERILRVETAVPVLLSKVI
jgi:RsmE family RNA methyltransferase